MEPPHSEQVAHVLGLGGVLDRVTVEVHGDELVELNGLVLDVGLEVEGRVDHFDLGDELLLVLEPEWLADVDDDTVGVGLVSSVVVFGRFRLKLTRSYQADLALEFLEGFLILHFSLVQFKIWLAFEHKY